MIVEQSKPVCRAVAVRRAEQETSKDKPQGHPECGPPVCWGTWPRQARLRSDILLDGIAHGCSSPPDLPRASLPRKAHEVTCA